MLLDATGCYWMLLAACWMVWHGRCAAHSLYGQRKPKRIIYWFGGLGPRVFQLCVYFPKNDRRLRAVGGLKWPCEKGLNCSLMDLRGPWVELARALARNNDGACAPCAPRGSPLVDARAKVDARGVDACAPRGSPLVDARAPRGVDACAPRGSSLVDARGNDARARPQFHPRAAEIL